MQAFLLKRWLVLLASAALLLVITFYNITEYPATWFDSGSYLHVPKSLVKYGVYADYGSEGFRYYGPTVGVGPTVLLPIALSFELFGIGLFQGRMIVGLYLLLAVLMFYLVALHLEAGDRKSNHRLAWVSTALLISSPGAALIYYGRQTLGEVPALFFLAAGLAIWFFAWERNSIRCLIFVGVLFGLAAVTKSQFLLVLAPALVCAWLLNLIYYRLVPGRLFLIPFFMTLLLYVLWQLVLVFYLGPVNASQNFHLLQESAAGAALVFSPVLMQRSVRELFSKDAYFGLLIPILAYGFLISFPRKLSSQKWGVLFLIVLVNMVWYVLASISWLRYLFPALAISSLFIGRFFYDLTGGFTLRGEAITRWQPRLQSPARSASRIALLSFLALIILLPLGQSMLHIFRPPVNYAREMAQYLNEHVSKNELIETWEPEMGFLTDHNYHYPPPEMLNVAINWIWRNGPYPADLYNFVQTVQPHYLLIGEFSKWVGIYPGDYIPLHYHLVATYGAYDLYEINP